MAVTITILQLVLIMPLFCDCLELNKFKICNVFHIWKLIIVQRKKCETKKQRLEKTVTAIGILGEASNERKWWKDIMKSNLTV